MKKLAQALSLVTAGVLLVGGISGCDSRGSCAIVRVYGVRAFIRGGASLAGSGNEGGSAGAGALAAAGAENAGGGQGGASSSGRCRATVVAESQELDYSETLECRVSGDDCDCTGLSEIDGLFEVTASLDDREETQEVTVRNNGCNVSTQELTFFED